MRRYLGNESIKAALFFVSYAAGIIAIVILVAAGQPKAGYGIAGVMAALPMVCAGYFLRDGWREVRKASREEEEKQLHAQEQALAKAMGKRRYSSRPQPAEDDEDPRAERPKFCRNCGKQFVKSFMPARYDQITGEVMHATAVHCPDWRSSGPDDEPGNCDNYPSPGSWKILPDHTVCVNNGKTAVCPRCRFEMVEAGEITQSEADALDLMYPA